MVHPSRLPGLWAVGEAVSTKQGWCEGALETAQRVAAAIMQYAEHGETATCSVHSEHFDPVENRLYAIYHDLLLDVTEWRDMHPGGHQAISARCAPQEPYTDLTSVFDHAHSTPFARKTLASLVVAYKYDDGESASRWRSFYLTSAPPEVPLETITELCR